MRITKVVAKICQPLMVAKCSLKKWPVGLDPYDDPLEEFAI